MTDSSLAQSPASRILVVDDTAANIQTLTATLKQAGYQVSVATNGKQALDVLARVTPERGDGFLGEILGGGRHLVYQGKEFPNCFKKSRKKSSSSKAPKTVKNSYCCGTSSHLQFSP